MGNCAPKPKRDGGTANNGYPPPPPSHSPVVVRLYGPSACPTTSRIRVALLYKDVTIEFHPTDDIDISTTTQPEGGVSIDIGRSNLVPATRTSTTTPAEAPTPRLGATRLQCGPDSVSGSSDAILTYIDSMLPGPPVLPTNEDEAFASSSMPGLAVAATLQHRSLLRLLEGVMAWAEDLVARGGVGGVADLGWRGSPRMEMRRFARRYSQVAEMLVEHAQMEERIIFPVLHQADPGICDFANEEHAKNLPIINGIKEDIKSIIVLDAGSSAYSEALSSLSSRLRNLLEHCREHFDKEERYLLPMLEVAEDSLRDECGGPAFGVGTGLLDKLVGIAMEATHSPHLFHFFMAGLLPQEALQYLDRVVCKCSDQDRVNKMLRSLASQMERTLTVSSPSRSSLPSSTSASSLPRTTSRDKTRLPSSKLLSQLLLESQ